MCVLFYSTLFYYLTSVVKISVFKLRPTEAEIKLHTFETVVADVTTGRYILRPLH